MQFEMVCVNCNEQITGLWFIDYWNFIVNEEGRELFQPDYKCAICEVGPEETINLYGKISDQPEAQTKHIGKVAIKGFESLFHVDQKLIDRIDDELDNIKDDITYDYDDADEDWGEFR